MSEPEERREGLPVPRLPLGGWITAALTAAPIPERLLRMLDARDEAGVANALAVKEDAWVAEICELFGEDAHRKVWIDYISKLRLSDEEFAKRSKVFTNRIAKVEEPEERIRFTFSAIRSWGNPNPVEYFAQMDERVARWRISAARSEEAGPDDDPGSSEADADRT
jgi:hypothetical protein